MDRDRELCTKAVIERFFQSPRGSFRGSTFNLHDAVVPSCLEEPATQQQCRELANLLWDEMHGVRQVERAFDEKNKICGF